MPFSKTCAARLSGRRNVDRITSCPGVQGAQHDHHQLPRPLSEGRARGRPGRRQTRGRVRLRLQQRPSSAHLQRHQLRVLPRPLPGARQPLRRSGAEARGSNHTQSTSHFSFSLWGKKK